VAIVMSDRIEQRLGVGVHSGSFGIGH